jgi:dienelactone hydrolase
LIWDAPSMYDQAAADEAWARTLGFFSRLLRA